MKISRSNSLTLPFMLTDEYAKKIFNSFEKFANSADAVEIEVNCTDNLTRQFQEIVELVEFENAPKCTIKAIRFKTFIREKDIKKHAYLEFDDDKFSNVSINIEGQEEDVVELNHSIEDYLEGMKPWYSKITKVDFFYLFIGLFFLILLFIMAVVWFGLIPFPETQPTKETSSKADILVGLFFISPIFFGLILNWFKDRVFPISYFAIGQGKKRYENMDYLRKLIVGVIVTGIVAMLVSVFKFIF